MTWTKFTFLLLGAYGLYYGFNILMDYLCQPKAKTTGNTRSLLLVDDVQPVVVNDADFAPANVVESDLTTSQHNGEAKDQQVDASTVVVSRDDSIPRPQPESGGVSLTELLRLYRQKALLQSAQYDFTT